MLNDEEKKLIENAFATAFDKWGQRYFEDLFGILRAGTAEEKSNAYKNALQEQSFLSKRAYEPGFYLHVLRETKSNSILKRQRLALIEACINSVLNAAGIKIKDHTDEKEKSGQNFVKETKPEEGQNRYTRREIQRLFHNYYSESFFEVGESKYSDGRFNLFSSVFAASDLPVTETSNVVSIYLEGQKRHLLSNHAILERLAYNSVLRFAVPEFLEDLIDFKNDCDNVFLNIGRNDERTKFLRNQIEDFSGLLILFHSYLTSILAMQWFRIRRKNGKKSLLEDIFPLKYDASDASKAAKLLTILTRSKDHTSYILQLAANSLFSYRMVEGTVSLFEECKKINAKASINQGILSENIAIAYRENKNYKLMLINAKQAVEEYKKMGNVYRFCVALKNTGEAQWMLGYKDAALKHFKEAEEYSMKLTGPSEHANVLINLAAACMRMKEHKMERSYHVKALKALPETETEKIIGLDRRLSELDRYC